MNNLLSKYKIGLILEKRVNWNQSVPGVTLFGLGKLISLFNATVKKGYRSNQLNSLILMLATEYVKAIEAYDTNKAVDTKTDDSVQSEEQTNTVQNNIENNVDDEDLVNITEEEYNKYKNNLQKFTSQATEIINSLLSIINKKSFVNIPDSEFKNIQNIFNKNNSFLVDDNRDDFPEIFMSQKTSQSFIKEHSKVIDLYNNIKSKNTLLGVSNVSKLNDEIVGNDFNKFKQYLQSINLNLDSIIKIYNVVLTKINIFTKCSKFVQSVKNLKDNTEEIKKQVEAFKNTNSQTIEYITKNIDSENEDVKKMYTTVLYIINKEYKNDENKTEETNQKKDQEEKQKENNQVVEKIIVEAVEKQIPNNVQSLMPKDVLMKFELIPDIKKMTFDKINLLRIDTINYQATVIINKAIQDEKNKAKAKDNDFDENTNDLKAKLEQGIKEVNDYFQKVVDIQKVMSSLKEPDSTKKETITQEIDTLDDIQKMGFTDDNMSTSNKFFSKDLYAFNILFKGQNNKKEDNMFLLLSPIKDYVININNDNYFGYKIFGQYKLSKKDNKIIRINLFKNKVNNAKIVNNFNDIENSYYIFLNNQKVSSSFKNMYIYSNKGNIFFDNGIGTFDEMKPKIEEFIKSNDKKLIEQYKTLGNLFDVKIHSRYKVDEKNYTLYEGIKKESLIKDNFVDVAINNHKKIIQILYKNAEPK